MKTLQARHTSTCAGCGGGIRMGDTITGSGDDWYHGSGGGSGCAPSGDPRADAEYLAEARGANRYVEDCRMFGQDYVDELEMDRELQDPEGW